MSSKSRRKKKRRARNTSQDSEAAGGASASQLSLEEDSPEQFSLPPEFLTTSDGPQRESLSTLTAASEDKVQDGASKWPGLETASCEPSAAEWPGLEMATCDFKEPSASQVPVSVSTVKFHLKSLPPAASDDVIADYFEFQGENVDILSIEKLQDDEAIISLSGLSEEECSTLLSKQHKVKKQIFSVEIPTSPEAETNSTLVEASGFSKEVSREYLELYFESRKSGGADGALEDCVIVQEGIAHLRFIDSEVADRVLSKKHVILGCSVQVKKLTEKATNELESLFELSKLEVTIPANVTPDRLSMYFSAVLELEEEEFTFEVNDTTCLLTFSSTYTQTELEAMCDKISHRKLKQAILTAQLVKVPCQAKNKALHEQESIFELNKLEVTAIPAKVSPDYLSLYFSKVLDMDEDEFTLQVKNTTCLITFASTYAQTKLEEMCDKIHQKKLKQATLVAQLVKVSCSLLVKNVDTDEEYLELYFSNFKRSGGCDVKDVHFIARGMAVVTFEDPKVLDCVLQRQHTRLGKNSSVEKYDEMKFANLSQNSFELKPADIHPLAIKCIHKNAECLAEGLEQLNLKISIQPDCLTVTPLLSEMPDDIKEQVIGLINRHFIAKVGIKFPEPALPEVTQLVTSLKETLLFEFSFSHNGTVPDVAGDKEAMAQFNTSLKKIHARHTQAEKTYELSVQEYQYVEEVILEQLKADFRKVLVQLDTSSTLKVSGSVADLEAFAQRFQEAKNHCSVDVNVSPLTVQYFCTPDGKAKAVEFIKKMSGAKICLHLHNNSLKLAFLCEPSLLESAKGIAKRLKNAMLERKLPFSESFQLARRELTGFEEFCGALQSSNKLIISCGDETIELAGFKEDVDSCAKSLMDYIEENSKLQKVVKFQKSMWKLFTTHMKEKWDRIVSRARELKIEFTQHSDYPHCTLFGDRVNVNTIVNSINRLKSSVHKKVIEIDRPGTCELFRSSKGEVYLHGIESQEKVAIEEYAGELEETSDDDYLPDDRASQANCVTKCTALSHDVRINICLGDITKFAADVIVNAANERLSHDGGVARAIADKGGPAIQEDCTQYVSRNGNVNTGNIYFTKTTGNLRCKALIHAVGPVWKHGLMNEEKLLYKVCTNSLSASQGYRSIVFPAISSGIYGFPIKKCADKMIQAVIDFSKANPTSSLREVTFIMLSDPTHAKEASVFIAKLKECLLQEKIQLESRPVLSMATRRYASPAQRVTHQASYVSPSAAADYMPPRAKEDARSTPVVEKYVSDKVELRKGGLLGVKADVYVNTTNTHLNLSHGAVSLALLKAGGAMLQQECSQKAPIRVGDVAVTGSGNIPCRFIFHTVVTSHNKHGEKILANTIRKCLQQCEQSGVKSIAFPSIGTGNLGYPNDVVARIMVKEVFDYLSSNKKSCIDHVYLVIFMQDTFDAFRREIGTHVPSYSAPAPAENRQKKQRASLYSSSPSARAAPETSQDSKSFTINNVTVNIVRGDITASSRDVIVNPTDSTISLTGQGVARAILQKGGDELKQLCHVLTANGKVLDDSTLVLETKATGALKSKSIFHISFEGRDSKKFNKIIAECLQKADRKGYTSITFPAIGTGVLGYPDEQAATGMLTAIHQSSKKLRCLKIIDIVLYQASIFQSFSQVFENPSVLKAGFFQKLFGFGVGAQSDVVPLEAGPQLLQDKMNFLICAETIEQARKAEKELRDFINEIFTTDFIHNPLINDLTGADEREIRESGNVQSIRVSIDRPSKRIQLQGDATKVHKVKCTIMEKLSAMEKNASKKREASQLSQVIKWKRMTSDGPEEYDDVTNYEIEQAYSKNPNGEYTHGNAHSQIFFTLKFKEMQEVDHISRNKSEVVRDDILKKGDVPDYWDNMPQGKTLEVVILDSKSKEYQEVLQNFETTMPAGRSYNSIVQIQRIQNRVLYSQYAARKKVMDDNNPGRQQNERKLFHGTRADTCPKVNEQGFNRSFAGVNATVYGNGVYFARDASYSARSTYSPPDANGYKYVYYVRVLTGVYTQGQRGLLVPPSGKDPKNPTILYDSVVDNVANPAVFVTFSDASNYPDYLIVFN